MYDKLEKKLNYKKVSQKVSHFSKDQEKIQKPVGIWWSEGVSGGILLAARAELR